MNLPTPGSTKLVKNITTFNKIGNNLISSDTFGENIEYAYNNLNISKSDQDLRESLNDSFESIKNISIDQQRIPIHTIDINSPIVMNNGNMSIIYQDIYGNEYDKNYIFYKDNTYFGLTDKIHKIIIDDNSSEINYEIKPYYSPINDSFTLFNLKQDLQEISYYVYSFVDFSTNEITYNRYFGPITYVNDIPMGENIPKITYGNVIQLIDPESVIINTYTCSTKIIQDNNDYNVILTDVFIPKIQFIKDDNDNILCDFRDKLETIEYKDCKLYSELVEENGVNNYRISISNDSDVHSLDNIYTVLSTLIDKYSLYSPINVIHKTSDTLLLKPITLHIPKLIYTSENGEYKPFIKEDLTSNIHISINEPEKSKYVLYIGNEATFLNKNDNAIFNEAKRIEKKIVLHNTEWFPVYSKDDISIFINKTQIYQDSNFNYEEKIDNSEETLDENSIINFLIQDKNVNEIYTNKIRLNNLPISKFLYTYTNIIINEPILEYTKEYMSYMDFLEKSTTSYQLQYVNSFSYKYYQQVGLTPSIEYVKDVLYERKGLELAYSYWSPDIRDYNIYSDKILEFNGNFYGSNIFKSNYLYELEHINENLHEIELIELFQRTKLNTVDNTGDYLTIYNAQNNPNFIKPNEDITYSTYLYKPFELKNEAELNFAYDYDFVPPKISYVINSSDVSINTYVRNRNAEPGEDVNKFTYKVTYSFEYDKELRNSETEGSKTLYSLTSFNTIKYVEYSLVDSNSYIDIEFTNDSSTFKNLIFNGETTKKFNNKDVINKSTLSIVSNEFTNFLKKHKNIKSIYSYEGYGPVLTTAFDFFTFKTDENNNGIYDILNNPKWSNKDIIVTTNDCVYEFRVKPKIDYNLENSSMFDNLITENESKSLNLIIEHEKNIEDEIVFDDDNTKTITINQQYAAYFTYTDTGKTYNYSSVVINDGYWKRKYNEVIKPLVNISYSYASNSINISNAYIVPNTKNERLGFIKQNKITYNVLENTYVEKYVYTYLNESNIQCLFDDTDENSLIIESNDKFYGIHKKDNVTIPKKLFTLNKNGLLQIWNETEYVLVKGLVENPNKFNGKSSISKITEKILKNSSQIAVDNKNFELYNDEFLKYRHGTLINENTYIGYKDDLENSNEKYSFVENIFSLNAELNYVNEMIELKRRLSVDIERHLKEVVQQEEKLISQNAQIDTPFGLVNGKKVIVTDEVYIPQTYVTVTTVDPETYNFISYEVVSEEAHFAYTYEIEDIPFITSSYIYTGEDGIKIKGLDNLIALLSGSEHIDSITENIKDNLANNNKNSENNKEWLKKINNTLLSYMTFISDSLSYMNSISTSLSYMNSINESIKDKSKDSENINKIIKTLSSNNKETILAQNKNITNIINVQKNMINKLSDSLSKQTTTLSKIMLTNSGNSEYINDSIFNDFSPQNWTTISLVGYEYSYTSLINSYKPVPNKSTKIINREQYRPTYVNRIGTHEFEEPKSIYYSYSNFIDQNMSSIERIGLKLNKETKDFSYNGYVYRQDIYSYQNLADILSDLHVSTRIPTRKEFIVDVSKRLYINSDFIFSYTSANEYAIRAIYRADVLWSELSKAGIVENTKIKLKDIPEEIITQKEEKNKWWKNKSKLDKLINKFNLDEEDVNNLTEEEFVKIEKHLKANNTDIDEITEKSETVKLIIKTNINNNEFIIDYLYCDSCGEVDCTNDELLYETLIKGETIRIGIISGNKSNIYEFNINKDTTIDSKNDILNIINKQKLASSLSEKEKTIATNIKSLIQKRPLKPNLNTILNKSNQKN